MKGRDVSAESSRLSVHMVASDGQTDPELLRMVRRHYDDEALMRLEGEIHFDAALSRAEVEALCVTRCPCWSAAWSI